MMTAGFKENSRQPMSIGSKFQSELTFAATGLWFNGRKRTQETRNFAVL
jgi:hypothetical protein